MTRKPLLLLVGAAMFALAPLTGAAAQSETNDDQVSVSDSTLEIGQSFTVSGQRFTEGTKVLFILNSDPVKLGVATANTSGVATLTAVAPNVPVGSHTITAYPTQATCTTATLSTCTQIVDRNRPTVTVSISARSTGSTSSGGGSGGGGTRPADTGSSHTRQLLGASFVLLAAGSSLVVAARRRGMHTASAV